MWIIPLIRTIGEAAETTWEGRRENDVLESISQPDIVLSKNFYKPKYVFCKLNMGVTFKISKQFPEEIGKKTSYAVASLV